MPKAHNPMSKIVCCFDPLASGDSFDFGSAPILAAAGAASAPTLCSTRSVISTRTPSTCRLYGPTKPNWKEWFAIAISRSINRSPRASLVAGFSFCTRLSTCLTELRSAYATPTASGRMRRPLPTQSRHSTGRKCSEYWGQRSHDPPAMTLLSLLGCSGLHHRRLILVQHRLARPPKLLISSIQSFGKVPHQVELPRRGYLTVGYDP